MTLFGNRHIEMKLGSENDDRLYQRVVHQLEAKGAERVDDLDLHAGSQDVVVSVFALAGQRVKLVRETYVGLSLVGKRSVVEAVLKDFNGAG